MSKRRKAPSPSPSPDTVRRFTGPAMPDRSPPDKLNLDIATCAEWKPTDDQIAALVDFLLPIALKGKPPEKDGTGALDK